jgi:hypothetical protein
LVTRASPAETICAGSGRQARPITPTRIGRILRLASGGRGYLNLRSQKCPQRHRLERCILCK